MKLSIAALLCLCAGLICAPAWAINPGDTAPEAAGIVLQGPPGTRLSALRGRVVVVDFWASWCAPCKQSMPELNGMYEDLLKAGYGDRFAMMGVSLDEDADDARKFLRHEPVVYPVVDDTLGIATKSYGVWRLPATFLLDQQGQIQFIWYGYGTGFTKDLKERIIALLSTPEATGFKLRNAPATLPPPPQSPAGGG